MQHGKVPDMVYYFHRLPICFFNKIIIQMRLQFKVTFLGIPSAKLNYSERRSHFRNFYAKSLLYFSVMTVIDMVKTSWTLKLFKNAASIRSMIGTGHAPAGSLVIPSLTK